MTWDIIEMEPKVNSSVLSVKSDLNFSSFASNTHNHNFFYHNFHIHSLISLLTVSFVFLTIQLENIMYGAFYSIIINNSIFTKIIVFIYFLILSFAFYCSIFYVLINRLYFQFVCLSSREK